MCVPDYNIHKMMSISAVTRVLLENRSYTYFSTIYLYRDLYVFIYLQQKPHCFKTYINFQYMYVYKFYFLNL